MSWPGLIVLVMTGSLGSKPLRPGPPPSCGQLLVTSMPAAAEAPLVAPVATSAVGPKPAVAGSVTGVGGRDPSAPAVAWPSTVPSKPMLTVSPGENPLPLTDTVPAGAANPADTPSAGPPATGETKNSSSAAGRADGPSTDTA